MDRKWIKIDRNGIGAFGYEIYQNTLDNERFLVKIFVYDKPILLSGTKEILANKISELQQIFNELSNLFPANEDIPFWSIPIKCATPQTLSGLHLFFHQYAYPNTSLTPISDIHLC